jgi:transitional endoplasmic reticulum ATPase
VHGVAGAARAHGLANALVLSGTDIVSPLVGSSEAALAAAFAAARALAPCVLVVDHFEALAGAGARSGALHEDRLLSVLLTELDGVGGGADAGVTLLAVAADPAALDPAVLRPGRLDLRVATALPTPDERRAVLRECAPRARAAVVDALVARTEGASHAAVVGAWRRAAMVALRRAAAPGAAGVPAEVALEDVA